MAVLLTILKIIGIVLLVIIGLVLLIILLVLLAPIRYRIRGNHDASDTAASAKVRFLCVSALADFKKDEGLSVVARLFGIRVLRKEITGKKDDADVKPQADNGPKEGITPVNTDAEQKSDAAQVSDAKPQMESGGVENELSADELSEDKPKPTPDERLEAVGDKLDTISTKLAELKRKKNHVVDFLDRDFVKRTIDRAKKLLLKLLKSVKPRKSKGYIHFGMESPADTGEILGKISAAYPLYGRWLELRPDFEQKIIEGNLDISGRIILMPIVVSALGLILSRDFRRTVKLAKKI